MQSIIVPDQERFHFKFEKLVSVIGPTGCGKSILVSHILRDRHQLMRPTPTRIIYVYNIWQDDLFKKIQRWCDGKVTFLHGFQALRSVNFSRNDANLVVLDDQQQQFLDSKEFGHQLVTVDVHHKNMLLIWIGQSLFIRARNATLVSRQTMYTIMFLNRRDMYECEYIGKKALQLKASDVRMLYKDAARYSARPYLLYDLNPETSEYRTCTTNILNTDSPYFFYYNEGENL